MAEATSRNARIPTPEFCGVAPWREAMSPRLLVASGVRSHEIADTYVAGHR